MPVVAEGQERRPSHFGRRAALAVVGVVLALLLLTIGAILAPIPPEGVQCRVFGVTISVFDVPDCQEFSNDIPHGVEFYSFNVRPAGSAISRPVGWLMNIRLGNRVCQLDPK